MALFKIFKGSSSALGAAPGANTHDTRYAHEGFAYFTTDDGKFYIDIEGSASNNNTAAIATYGATGRNRIAINAEKADRDKLGQIIDETYAVDLDLDSHTLTLLSNNNTILQTVTLSEDNIFDIYEDNGVYSFRKTGGNLNLDFNEGVEKDEIVGATVAWNQVLTPKATMTSGGITFTKRDDHTLVLSGENTSGASVYYIFEGNVSTINGHVYFVDEGVVNKNNNIYIYNDGNGVSTLNTSTVIGKATADRYFYVRVNAGVSIDGEYVMHPNAIDLTRMFGNPDIANRAYALEQSTAGSGIAWLRSYGFFTEDYYAYDAGSLQSVKLSAHKTTGKNLFDKNGELTNNSFWNVQTGSIVGNNEYYLTDYIPVCGSSVVVSGNTMGYVGSNGSVGMGCFDAGKNLIRSANTTVLDITGAAYVRLSVGKVDIDTFQCELGTTATAYEPYKENTYPLDSTVEWRGMYKLVNNNIVADGDVYPSSGQGTRKWVIVNLCDLNWLYNSQRHYFNAQLPYNAKFPAISSSQHSISSRYPSVSDLAIWNETVTFGMAVYPYNISTNKKNLAIADSEYTDTDTFKSAMSDMNVQLIYEVETPTTETANSYPYIEYCHGKGTEEYVDAAVAAGIRDVAIPAGHNTQYRSNKYIWNNVDTITGVNAGSYGPSANATPAYGATFDVPEFTVDSQGRITSASTKTVTIPASDNVDTKVKQNVSTSEQWRKVLFSKNGETTASANISNGAIDEVQYTNSISIQPSSGTLAATKFKGPLEGNADTATKATQDSDGNAINTTYLKKSGGTMTGALYINNQNIANDFSGGSLIIGSAAGSHIAIDDNNIEAANGSSSSSLYLNYLGGSVVLGGNLLPKSNGTLDIGSSGSKWANVYAITFTGNLVGNADTATALTSNAGSGTQPVYFSNGKPTALTYTANRLYYSASTTSFAATGHYASSNKIAVNSSSEPTQNFYVNGTTRIKIPNGSVINKDFVVQGRTFENTLCELSIGDAGIQAYNYNTYQNALYLQPVGGHLIVGNSTSPLTHGYLYGAYEFPSALGFKFSGIATANANQNKPIWFDASGSSFGTPAYSLNLQYNPSTNTLTTGNLYLSGNADLNGETTADSLTAGNLEVTGSANFVNIPTAPTAAAGTNNTQLATTEFVTGAVTGLAGPMRFIGTLGTGGTITSLPTAAESNKGWTYKVITKGTYGSTYAEVGDLFISNGSSWVNIPSGDVPDGTVTNIATGDGLTGGPITSTGTISHDVPTNASAGSRGSSTDRYYIKTITTDKFGHVTGVTTGNETVVNTDTLVQQTAKTDNKNYKLLFTSSDSPTSGNAATAAYDTDITANPSTNTIVASYLQGTAKHSSAAHFSKQDSDTNGVLKVKINKKTSWMIAFTLRVYQAYTYYDYVISGYNYNTSHWYCPSAKLLSADTTAEQTVTFGYDDDANANGYCTLWVSIPISSYTGADVFNVTNGHGQIDIATAFQIIHETTSTGIVQATKTCSRPWYRNETVTKAEQLATARKINGTDFNGTADITTSKWGTSRNISISDSDGTNTGSAVSVDGSGAATLKLPATIKASLTGNASSATKAGVSTIWLYPEYNNEINFGGTYTDNTTIYFGYRTKDSRAIPTKFIFGSSTGTADLQAKTVYLGSGTTSYISSTQYTGNAATATALTTSAGSGTQPVYFSNGVPTALTYTANRLYYSASTTSFAATGHYASSSKIAVNSTSAPTENFYVDGNVRFAIGNNDVTSDKRFIIGSSGKRYLSFGGSGVQAYSSSNEASTLFVQHFGGNIQVGQSVAVTSATFRILDATMTGNLTLNGETVADSLTAGNLEVTGAAHFVNIPTLTTSPAAGDSSTKLATTAFVTGAVNASVTGVKGNNESSYRTGQVNITPVNIHGTGTTGQFWRGDNSWSSTLTGNLTLSNNSFLIITGATSSQDSCIKFTDADKTVWLGVRRPLASYGPSYYDGSNHHTLVRLASTIASGQVLVADGTAGNVVGRGIINNTSAGAAGWNSAGAGNATNISLITLNTLSYWNGAYTSTSSNLQYSKNGEIMGLSTAQTVSATKTFSAIQKFTNTTDSSHSQDTNAAVSISGGLSVAKKVSAREVRIDNNQSSKGVTMQYDASLEILNFVFS